jgi:hypothetical protein
MAQVTLTEQQVVIVRDCMPELLRLNHVQGKYVWNYQEIYDPDEPDKAMSDNARVWRVYNDESERQDADLVEGWRSTLDTQLIFVSRHLPGISLMLTWVLYV